MTIPWMMNCSHKGDGWCLDCVYQFGQAYAELQIENIKLKQEVSKLEKDLYTLTYDDGCMFGGGKYD